LAKVKPIRRNVSGFIVLDKPYEMSSNDALQKVKRIFNAKKAGHTGSLDPLATGVLPLCLGEATKLSQFLLDADKAYTVVAHLGMQTTTGDAEGDVIKKMDIPADWQAKLPKVLEKFLGKTQQIPSMFSAIKYQGKPLYEYARQGIEVPREPRDINLYELELLDVTNDTFTLHMRCSKGTYVRTLVEDIAIALGTCAYTKALKRTQAGPYQEADMVSIETLEQVVNEQGFVGLQQFIRPLDTALASWPAIQLSSVASHYIKQGQAIRVNALPEDGYVRLMSEQAVLLGIGEVMGDGTVAPKRLINPSQLY
jgi:tRNA pseudouridine55 synthase